MRAANERQTKTHLSDGLLHVLLATGCYVYFTFEIKEN